MEVTSKILAKVKALLARADADQNDNEHERATAMRQAQKLMDQYNLALMDVNAGHLADDRGQEGFWISPSQKWKRLMYNTLAPLYGVTTYRDKDHMFILTGNDGNRQALRAMGSYVIKSVEREAKKHSGEGRQFVNSFKRGSVHGVKDTVNSMLLERSKQPTGKGLIPVDYYTREEELNLDWLKDLGVVLTNRASRANLSSYAGAQAGREHGSSISLNSQIAKDGGQKLLG